jgi:hypothetical protein
MQLNDTANDAERQQLLPFVTKLACADTAQVEQERAAYIAVLAAVRERRGVTEEKTQQREHGRAPDRTR